MSYRTNKRTRGVFRLSTIQNPDFVRYRKIPAESKYLRDIARGYGLSAKFEMRPLSEIAFRGLPYGEDNPEDTIAYANRKDRLDYIRAHIDQIPFIVIHAESGDVIDGNHRYLLFKELGLQEVPVLAVDIPFVSEEDVDENALDLFEDFMQRFNGGAGWEDFQ